MTRRRLITGYDRILHGGDYNPDQWLRTPEIIDADFRLMNLARCNTFTLGVFSWSSYEAREGAYDFGWLDEILGRIERAGNKAILATPSAAKPAWLSKKYPEIRRVTRAGQREPHGGRANHCWTSPIFRDKVAAVNRRLAERYAAHPALGMWHLSNEYVGECYCDGCLERWQRWLEHRFGSIEALNAAWCTAFWGHTFSCFDEIDPRDTSIDAMQLDWRRFFTDLVIDFMHAELAALREHSKDVPATTNLMGLLGQIDYSRLVRGLDFVSDDQYPAFAPDDPNVLSEAQRVSFKNDLFRCMKPDRPWLLMESCPDAPQHRYPVRLKRPGLHQTEMLQALGHGAEGTCYFQWRKNRGGSEKLHGAVVDHVGNEHTRVFRSVEELGKNLERLAPVLGSAALGECAIIYDWEVRWGFEGTEGVRSANDAYTRVAIEHYAALARQGVTIDVIDGERSLDGYKLVVAPQLFLLKPGMAERLRRFVEGGGCVVATYYTGICDQYDRCFLGGAPGDGLMSLFGLWNEETDYLADGAGRTVVIDEGSFAGTYRAEKVCALVELRGARALGRYAEDFYAGTPALTEHRLGSGSAYYQATSLGPDFLRKFYAARIADLAVPRAFECELPEGVLVQTRVRDDRQFFFVQNFSEHELQLTLPHPGLVDLLTGGEGGRAVRLSAWASTVLSNRAT